jgi:hypothetical protein
MRIENDVDFWRRRADQARAMADRAITPAIRQIHLARADLYAAHVRDSERLISRPYIRSA